jgi:SAM-dependent methyltransferase
MRKTRIWRSRRVSVGSTRTGAGGGSPVPEHAPPTQPKPKPEEPKYRYFWRVTEPIDLAHSRQDARELGEERLHPHLRNPDFLVLDARRKILSGWLTRLQGSALSVLNVGGRIQPYRSLIADRTQQYVAIDPQIEGLVDVVAVGERLPFPDDRFDVVICTQVLSYAADPWQLVGELKRVLRPGGTLLLSAPAFFPQHHDERWRFVRNGLQLLLGGFSSVEIVPEGASIAGICRSMSVAVWLLLRRTVLRRLAESSAESGTSRLSFRHGHERPPALCAWPTQ